MSAKSGPAPVCTDSIEQPRPVERAGSLLKPMAVVGLTALAVQFAYLATAADDPTAMSPIVDSATYHNTALEMARGRQGAPEPFFQPPAYPWFLSILYHLFGVNFWVVKVIQGVLGATTCMIVVAVGARMRSPKIGLAAGLVSALNGPLVFFNSQLLAVVIIALFYALSVWLLIVAVQEERWYWWLCFGFSVGLGASARPDILVLALVAVGYLILIVMIRRRQVELGLVRAALIIGSAMVPILPIAIRNTAAAGQPVFISTNAGINLYIGNNLERHRTLGIRPGEEWYELRRRPLLEGLKDTRDHDRYFQIQVVQYVVRHPGHFLRGLCEKTYWFFHGKELPRTLDIYNHSRYSRLLNLLVWQKAHLYFPFGVMFPFAVIGIIRSARQAPGSLIVLCLIAYAAVNILFFPSARYRAPLIPFFAYYACLGAVAVALQGWETRKRIAAGLAVLGLGILFNWPIRLPTDRTDFHAEMIAALGYNAMRESDNDEAIRRFGEVLQRDPGHAEALRLLGYLKMVQGSYAEAEDLLRSAISQKPASAEAHASLARVRAALGDAAGAIHHYEESARLFPYDANVLISLGSLLNNQQEFENAAAVFEDALRIDPTNGVGHNNFAIALMYVGRYHDAWLHVHQAASYGAILHPGFVRQLESLMPDPWATQTDKSGTSAGP